KVAQSRFVYYKGAAARLERALYNFMLDTHTSENGYEELVTPYLVNDDSMYATEFINGDAIKKLIEGPNGTFEFNNPASIGIVEQEQNGVTAQKNVLSI